MSRRRRRILRLWDERYKGKEEVYDYSGRIMKKSAIGDRHSKFQPTLDHIKPSSKKGKDIKGNIEICNRVTNKEKNDSFDTWTANGHRFKAIPNEEEEGAYTIEKIS